MASPTQLKHPRLCAQKSTSDLSSLEKLPSELVWMVIEYAPETVSELRLASRQLKFQVDNLALHSNTISLVKTVNFTGYEIKEICIHVREEKAQLFELRIKLRKLAANTIRKIRCLKNYFSGSVTISYNFGFNESHSRLGWLDYFQSFGKIIEIVKFADCITPIAGHFISTLLEGHRCNRVEVDQDIMNELDLQFLLNFIRAHKVVDVVLGVTHVNCSEPVNVLYDLSNLVRTLRIYQYRNFEIKVGDSYLFGVKNADWAHIIFEMFSRNLDKFRIRNIYSQYLSPVDVELLRENLPRLGKKIWFEASCNTEAECMDYEIGDHHVIVEQSGSSSTMSLKHSSRKHESRHF